MNHKPQIGDAVNYFPPTGRWANPNVTVHDPSTPMRASVAYVHSNECVSVSFTDHAGFIHAAPSVKLKTGTDVLAVVTIGFCVRVGWIPASKLENKATPCDSLKHAEAIAKGEAAFADCDAAWPADRAVGCLNAASFGAGTISAVRTSKDYAVSPEGVYATPASIAGLSKHFEEKSFLAIDSLDFFDESLRPMLARVLFHHFPDSYVVVCLLVLKNGHTVLGSVEVEPDGGEPFDLQLARQLARQDAESSLADLQVFMARNENHRMTTAVKDFEGVLQAVFGLHSPA